MIRRPVPWPNGAKVAVAITFDMDADSLVHIAHPSDSITRVSTISMLRYGPEVSVPRILEAYRRYGLKQTFFVPAWCIEHYPEAVEAMDELVSIVKSGQPVCLLCYERDKDCCHRSRIAEIVHERTGIGVVDLVPLLF